MKLSGSWVFLSLLIFSYPLLGQEKWTFEFKPWLNFPSTELGETSLGTGYGFELLGSYKVLPEMDVYVGWGWNQFKTKDALINEERDVNETGYSFGLKFKNSFLNFDRTSYVLSAGGIFNHLEVENRFGETTADTGHGIGWQVSAGLEYIIAENWTLRPELRYRSFSKELTFMNYKEQVDHRYISLGLGLAVSF